MNNNNTKNKPTACHATKKLDSTNCLIESKVFHHAVMHKGKSANKWPKKKG